MKYIPTRLIALYFLFVEVMMVVATEILKLNTITALCMLFSMFCQQFCKSKG